MQDNLINQFILNLKLAGGEVLEEIPYDYYVTSAHIGVAENGAVWVSEYTKELFLSEKVCVKLPKKILPTMHKAVKEINTRRCIHFRTK